jgi:hypothetical protein
VAKLESSYDRDQSAPPIPALETFRGRHQREAHPVSGPQLSRGVRVVLFDLKTLEVYRIVLAGLEETA